MYESELVCLAPISSAILADAFGLAHVRGDEVSAVRLHPIDYADLLKVGPGFLSESLLRQELSVMIETGVWAKPLWGAPVVRDPECEEGAVIVQGAEGRVLIRVVR